MIEAVFFDLDETLISHSQQLRLFIRAQYDRYVQLHKISVDRWEERFITLDENGYVTKDIVYSRLFEEFSIDNLTPMELFNDFLGDFHRHVVPLPHMRDVLENIRYRGLKTGIITNGGHLIQLRKIQQLGLENFVDVILTSEQEEVEKPNPEIFLRGSRRLNVAPEHCMFVGDHQINDVGGAKRAGMTAVWISGRPWEETEFFPDHSIGALMEIRSLLDAYLAN